MTIHGGRSIDKHIYTLIHDYNLKRELEGSSTSTAMLSTNNICSCLHGQAGFHASTYHHAQSSCNWDICQVLLFNW